MKQHYATIHLNTSCILSYHLLNQTFPWSETVAIRHTDILKSSPQDQTAPVMRVILSLILTIITIPILEMFNVLCYSCSAFLSSLEYSQPFLFITALTQQLTNNDNHRFCC